MVDKKPARQGVCFLGIKMLRGKRSPGDSERLRGSVRCCCLPLSGSSDTRAGLLVKIIPTGQVTVLREERTEVCRG